LPVPVLKDTSRCDLRIRPTSETSPKAKRIDYVVPKPFQYGGDFTGRSEDRKKLKKDVRKETKGEI
jgi:hypothetical protein